MKKNRVTDLKGARLLETGERTDFTSLNTEDIGGGDAWYLMEWYFISQ